MLAHRSAVLYVSTRFAAWASDGLMASPKENRMRNTRWLRFGLATILLGCGASAAFLVACVDDDVTPTPGTDSGGGTDTGTTDSGTTDSATDTGVDSGPKLPNAKLVVVNAA